MTDIIKVLLEKLTKEERDALRDLIATETLDEYDRTGTIPPGQRSWNRNEAITRLLEGRFPEPKPEPVTIKRWINVPKEGYITAWESKQRTDHFAPEDCIACIEQEITYTPGEGICSIPLPRWASPA